MPFLGVQAVKVWFCVACNAAVQWCWNSNWNTLAWSSTRKSHFTDGPSRVKRHFSHYYVTLCYTVDSIWWSCCKCWAPYRWLYSYGMSYFLMFGIVTCSREVMLQPVIFGLSVCQRFYYKIMNELLWNFWRVGVVSQLLWVSCTWPWKNIKLICITHVIRPHRSTTYVDAACCYRSSSVVCLSVCLSHWWALQKRLNWSRCHLGWGPG